MNQQCCTNDARFLSGGEVSLPPEDRPSTLLAEDERPEIRVDKVLEIRRQLGEGTYSIADRLDLVVEKIIAELADSGHVIASAALHPDCGLSEARDGQSALRIIYLPTRLFRYSSTFVYPSAFLS